MTMNLNLNAKSCGATVAAPTRASDCRPRMYRGRENERGYTLVALLALMTIFAILAMAVAPSIKQQNQRVKEAEAIARGEEVAQAIRLYIRAKNALPTSIDQLLEGIPQGTKKIQILRPEAARDPLSSSGEWQLIRQTDPAILEFERAIISYAGAQPSFANSPLLRVPRLASVLNIGSGDKAPAAEDNAISTEGPFIGVASRSKNNSVITYYGIDHHDGWIFTPAINPRCDASPASCE